MFDKDLFKIIFIICSAALIILGFYTAITITHIQYVNWLKSSMILIKI